MLVLLAAAPLPSFLWSSPIIAKDVNYLRKVRLNGFLRILIQGWRGVRLWKICPEFKIWLKSSKKNTFYCQWHYIVIMFYLWFKWCQSVRPSPTYQRGSHPANFRWIWLILRGEKKICPETPNFVKIGFKNSGTLHENLSTFYSYRRH